MTDNILEQIIRKTIGMNFTCEKCGDIIYLCCECGRITHNIITLPIDFMRIKSDVNHEYRFKTNKICCECCKAIISLECIYKERVSEKAWQEILNQYDKMENNKTGKYHNPPPPPPDIDAIEKKGI